MSKLKEKLMLSEKGYSDLKKAITACTITNIALLLPSMVGPGAGGGYSGIPGREKRL